MRLDLLAVSIIASERIPTSLSRMTELYQLNIHLAVSYMNRLMHTRVQTTINLSSAVITQII